MARTARPEHSVARIRRTRSVTESSAFALGRIGAGCCEIGTIKEIENLQPELGAKAFLELPKLQNRKIHIFIGWAGEDALACVTNGSVSRRSQNASVLNVASVICERSEG